MREPLEMGITHFRPLDSAGYLLAVNRRLTILLKANPQDLYERTGTLLHNTNPTIVPDLYVKLLKCVESA
jgi:hypothetical protein